MASEGSELLVEPIRTVSRKLVRELGFMSTTIAETNYTAPAVHSLIEIGHGNAATVMQLSGALNLEKSKVQQIIQDLVEAGEVTEPGSMQKVDERLSLTKKGQESLAKINAFARDQVLKALSHMATRDAETILYGLQIYAASLHTQRTGKAEGMPQKILIRRGYQMDLIARTLQMHKRFYTRQDAWGSVFEHRLAGVLADLVSRLDNERNEAWTATLDGMIVGTVYVDGETLGSNKAQLRAFIVDDEVRGSGVGRRLLADCLAFTAEHSFDEVHLWTYRGLDAARRLYESFGFVLAEELEGAPWGKPVTQQRFVLRSNAS